MSNILMVAFRDLFGDRRGAAAVEFALVETLFSMTTLFVMLVGAILYITQAIDYATNAAARDILTGAAQANSVTASTFTQSLRGRLPPGITCANLIVNLYTVTEASQPGGYYTYVKSVFGPATLIVIDVVFNFTPTLGSKFFPAIKIARSAYVQPRYASLINYDTTNNDGIATKCPGY